MSKVISSVTTDSWGIDVMVEINGRQQHIDLESKDEVAALMNACSSWINSNK